jgi:hypothetical protein
MRIGPIIGWLKVATVGDYATQERWVFKSISRTLARRLSARSVSID